jgi:hypothetical protein
MRRVPVMDLTVEKVLDTRVRTFKHLWLPYFARKSCSNSGAKKYFGLDVAIDALFHQAGAL